MNKQNIPSSIFTLTKSLDFDLQENISFSSQGYSIQIEKTKS